MSGPIYYTCTDQRCEQSQVEQEIIGRLQALGLPVVPQVKLGNNWVFDGAVNGTRIIVEIHGEYWHTRPEVQERDGRKQAWADQNGYLILTIWETEYRDDPDSALLTVLEHYESAKAFALPAEGDKSNTPSVPGSVYGDWRDRFLAVLSETGIVREACIAAGVSRKTAYQYRADDQVFTDEWKLALQDAADVALVEYRKRALQQSDRAMEFFIRSRDPDQYGERAHLQAIVQYLDLAKLTNEQIERLANGDDPIQILLGGAATPRES
jgi:very-short-patch-repair endonuclease